MRFFFNQEEEEEGDSKDVTSSWHKVQLCFHVTSLLCIKCTGYIANSLWTLSGMVTVCLIASDMFPEILPGTNILERCRWSRFRDPDITLPFYSLAKEFFETMEIVFGWTRSREILFSHCKILNTTDED